MFRDLKEYQEIAKIYAEKVSKPEELEERVRGGGMQSRIKPFEKPAPQVSGQRDNRPQMKGGIEIKKPTVQSAQGRTKPKPEIKKSMPTTAEIRAANPGKVGGGNAGASADSGGTAQIPTRTTFTRQGKERTRAQQMAADRIAAKKASPMDKQLTGRERAQQAARDRIAAKRAEAQKF